MKCFYITHDARPLTMDAPSWGDTGGHTGTAPTNLHQTPLPRNLLHLVHRQTIRRQSFLVFAH
ncbi:hypothetical protein [Segatella oulorum]|uniref:hypothetical protein n=1 Tax=Segatella oulorum TaxID=28136 RepID=UPI0028E5D20B|nr:hypothetical protein [Segatella oulorum]